jgi:16S rRNA (cytidine1402-2'-O)-methyltransferase
VANDLTKMFEAVSRGSLAELLSHFGGVEPLGEYVVVIAGAKRMPRSVES